MNLHLFLAQCAGPVEGRASDQDSDSRHTQMARILEIGDGQGSVAQMADALNHEQFDLDYAASEGEALHALSLSEYDLILITFLRPELNVSSLCQQIRQLFSTPIVVCSMSGQER